MMRRLLLLVSLVGALLGAALSVAAPAWADTPAPGPNPTATPGPPTSLQYKVSVTSYSTNAAGTVTPQTPFTDVLTVDCSSRPCSIQAFAAMTLDVPGTTTKVFPGSGTACGQNFRGTETVTVTVDANGFVGTLDQLGSGVQDCGSGNTAETYAEHEDLKGVLIAGDPCLVGGPCATASAAPTAANGSGAPSAHTFASPGTLSTLPTVADATRPANLVWAVALTVVLVILVALPTNLLNSAVEHGTERLAAWRRRIRPSAVPSPVEPVETPDATTTPEKPVRFAGWPLAATGVLAASLISSFVDPSFGFNAGSIRTFLSILVSFLLDAVAGWFLLIWLVRRTTPTATAHFRFAPATLLIVIAAVAFTRITGFQPGIVFGLVAGVAFGTVVATSDKAKHALVTLGFGFAIAVVGWIGYSVLAPAGDVNAAIVFIRETLSSMAIGGIAALPIALIPLRGLTGHTIFEWSKWAWGAAYGIGLFGFFFVLMPFPFAWKGVPLSIGVWIGLYLLYAVIAIGGWLLLARPWEKAVAADAAEGKTAEPERA